MNRMNRLAATGAALLLAAGAAGSATASESGWDGSGPHPSKEREAAALTGTAMIDRPKGDEITFTFDAHLDAKDEKDPGKAHGTIKFSHYMEQPQWGGAGEAKVDCLMTGGKVATVSAVITRADGDLKNTVGKRVGLTIHDQGKQDRFGYSWAMVGLPSELPDDMPKCVSAAPFEKTRPGSGTFHVLPMKDRS
ncbi:Repetin [Streptomyces sp. NPDC059002]|uniref:Repetin n=1 Tax=Streptomyces sp. NPDC059002 TaxID=3346690 RepID=UPI003675DA0D